MKKLYWRPQRLSLRLLLLIAAVAGLALGAVETVRVHEKQRWYGEKLQAARLALRAFKALKEERLRRGLPIDAETDPARSGLIGELISPVTTNTGHLTAKQTSINPNFAAVVVELLLRANVKAGDTVALGFSGSFPALNVAVLAAVETLRVTPVVITSAGASQWGANQPTFMWPDMEMALLRWHIFSHRSAAASPGGIDDRALGLSKRGRNLVRGAVARNGLPLLEVRNYDDSLTQRMALYRERAGDAEIKAYVNVGGGTTSVGTRVGRDLFSPGLNRRLPRGPQIDSVMTRFVQQGVPVIHLSKISKLAQDYGLELQPRSLPAVGQGKTFFREAYNPWLAGGALLAIVALLVGFLRLDWGHRLLAGQSHAAETARPEPMI
ncbi:MAG: poly-gamma-glutamate system protein [Proteobacteria bacterium]|nr:poly-gamma-glutamate system protein [Pseudomonadota bacterium]